MDLLKKLEILADAAKYDASCASSGTAKRSSLGEKNGIGSTEGMGICHAYAPDGRCISLLKILLTNSCVYDCLYCINRRSSNVQRARFTPEEVVTLTLGFIAATASRGFSSVPASFVAPTTRWSRSSVWRSCCAKSTGSAAISISRPFRTRRPNYLLKRGAMPTVSASTSSCRPRAAWPRSRRKRTWPAFDAPWAACGCASTSPRPKSARRNSLRPARARSSSSAPTRAATATSSTSALICMGTTVCAGSTSRRSVPSPTRRPRCHRPRRRCSESIASIRPTG